MRLSPLGRLIIHNLALRLSLIPWSALSFLASMSWDHFSDSFPMSTVGRSAASDLLFCLQQTFQSGSLVILVSMQSLLASAQVSVFLRVWNKYILKCSSVSCSKSISGKVFHSSPEALFPLSNVADLSLLACSVLSCLAKNGVCSSGPWLDADRSL